MFRRAVVPTRPKSAWCPPMTKRFLSAALALSSICLPVSAYAQFANDPFFDHTVPLSQAYGFESIGLGLDLAATFSPPYDEELVETLEGLTGTAYQRFKGSLENHDGDLAASLAAALHEVGEAAEDGEDPTEAIAEARDLLAKAYEAVIPADLRDSAAFKGGLMIDLLLAEGGVAEGYEEAVENQEPWEYPNGWVALQRVKALWDDVKDGASPERLADGQEMLDLLDTLYPEAEPPASVAGWNPEEAEGPAQRLGGIIEDVTDANLYPGRDVARLVGHLGELTTAACAVYPDDEGLAVETIYAVYDLYDAEVAGVASMFAEETAENASDLFGHMIAVEDDDDDEAATSSEEEAADGGDELSAADACGELAVAFGELKTVLGG